MRTRIQTLARIPKRWSKESQLRVQLRKTRAPRRALTLPILANQQTFPNEAASKMADQESGDGRDEG
jgi:hypothetical protein